MDICISIIFVLLPQNTKLITDTDGHSSPRPVVVTVHVLQKVGDCDDTVAAEVVQGTLTL